MKLIINLNKKKINKHFEQELTDSEFIKLIEFLQPMISKLIDNQISQMHFIHGEFCMDKWEGFTRYPVEPKNRL